MTTIDQLFDTPGPRARRKNRIASALSIAALIVGVALVLYFFGRSGGLDREKWTIFTRAPVLHLLWSGLVATLKAAATAGVAALLLGVFLASARMSHFRPLRAACQLYVEVCRCLPTLLVLYFTILLLPNYGINLPVYWQLVFALTISNSAMIAEIVRSSLMSIPTGQTDAALSLGVTHARAIRLVVLPQAFRISMPALIAQLVYLMKSSTLGYVVSYQELLYNGKIIGEYTYFLLQSFLVVAAVYLVINMFLTRLALWLESRMSSLEGRRSMNVLELTE